MSDKLDNLSANTNNLKLEFEDFAYRVSHDLSAPIRAMVEFSKLLTQEFSAGSLTESGKEYLSLIIESGQKVQLMMDGLLAYSRINTNKPNYSWIDSEILVKQIYSSLEHSNKNLELVFIGKNLPKIYADIEQIRFVFEALIDNAIKFQPPINKPRVTISVEKIKNYLQFSVEDNGIGIGAQFLEKIFKLFATLHVEKQYNGVGLGLTLAQKIINKNGGSIWVKSTPGKGSIFYFTLPLNTEI